MDILRQDVRYAIRALLRTPVFTLIAIATLALGIGANSAIFSVVNAVLLQPLPFPDSDRLVQVYAVGPREGRMPLSYPDYLDIREKKRSFTGVAALTPRGYSLTGKGDPRDIDAALASPELFDVLAVRPALGRTFTDAETRQRVAVISHSLWRSAFGGEPSAVGQSLTLDDRPYTVIGVMPAGFRFPQPETELWTPVGGMFEEAPEAESNRGFRAFDAIGRLKPAATLEGARAELGIIAKQAAAAMRADPRRPRLPPGMRMPEANMTAQLMRDTVVGDARAPLLILLGAVALVLLIACANAANLLLARANARRKEIGVRAALGATRARLTRQLLTESVLLALVAGAIGTGIGYIGVRSLMRVWAGTLPRSGEVGMDGWVLGFTLLISVGTGIAFGIVPALRASAVPLEGALREDGWGSTGGRRRQRTQKGLIVGEVALALVLLVGAGLLVRSFARLSEVDPGFDPNNVLTARLRLTPARYPQPAQQHEFFRQLLEQMRANPAVELTALSRNLPLTDESFMIGLPLRQIRPDATEPFLPVGFGAVSPGFFRAMRTPVLRGRDFGAAEQGGAIPTGVIINETLAKKLWPDDDPIGRPLPMRTPATGPMAPLVVGVVKDVRYTGLDTAARPELYLPYFQSSGPSFGIWVVLRARSNAVSLTGALRDAVKRVDAQQSVGEIVTLQSFVDRSTAARRFNTTMITAFAAIALVLSIIGIYGLTAYSVSQRTRELGIRMALGARGTDVLRMLLGEGARLAGAGVVLGMIGAFAATRVLAGMLYDVSATDPLTFVVTAALLVSAALLAVLVPARRATTVDPMLALRQDVK
jgi:putative ABC transport system permease protein